MAALWYGMPFRDSVSPLTGNRFWEEAGPYTYLEALKQSNRPTTGAWEDDPTGQVILAAQNLGSRLLLGPGSHCAPPPDFDLAGEVRRYFDRHLLSEKVEADSAARVTWWLEGAPKGREWQHSPQPPTGAKPERWSLAVAGEKTAAPVRHNPLRSARAPVGEASCVDWRRCCRAFPVLDRFAHGRGLSFTGPVLDRPQVTGFRCCWRSVPTGPSRCCSPTESLTPEGRARDATGGLRRPIVTGKPPYDTLGLPFHTGLAADFACCVRMKPRHCARLCGSLAKTRLRLVITGADPRQRNLQQIRLDPPPQINVHTGSRAGSWIELPLAGASTSF
jgi:hypothetical protein